MKISPFSDDEERLLPCTMPSRSKLRARPRDLCRSSLVLIAFLLMALLVFNLAKMFLSEALFDLYGSLNPFPVPLQDAQLTSLSDHDSCDSIPKTHRFDCFPDFSSGITRDRCEARNCCFVPVPGQHVGIGVPWCFFPPGAVHYEAETPKVGPQGISSRLAICARSGFPDDVVHPLFTAAYENDGRLRLRINDSEHARFEVPFDLPPPSTVSPRLLYTVELSRTPFGFVVKRKATGTVLLNATVAPLVFANQLLQLSWEMPTHLLYGLGEHRAPLLLNTTWSRRTMWAGDQGPKENTNLYGSQPFYLALEDDGSAHGVFLLNSNAMDVVLQPAPAITWRSIGGIFDFYVFLGPRPEDVIRQFLAVVGMPLMPPYWGLGFHLCRWGYGSSNATLSIIQAMRDAQMPQDVQWNDIDYMHDREDFSYNKKNFTGLPDVVENLHNHGQKYIVIVDPAISSNQTPGSYKPFDDGVKRGVFVRDSSGNKILIGKVWPGLTAFPDFSTSVTQEWWFECLRDFHSKVPFDGLWIDMNEPSNFVDGSVNGCPNNTLENPPFTPAIRGSKLNYKTVCTSARHAQSSHYNLHNLYGLFEANATYRALERLLNKRPFVISRSTFAGQGRYSGHWTGDNWSHWWDLRMSIPAILNFNLFGIPLVGADICGFTDNTTEELCIRWMQLGAFYPFSRNHNDIRMKSQEPVAFSKFAQRAIRMALDTRYILLPFLYTLFHHAHMQGTTVARPLFFEFPDDKVTHGIDQQFLWGSSLLITPVLKQGATKVTGYFPSGTWYDLFTGIAIVSQGENVSLEAPLDKINVHIRANSIVPVQGTALTTAAGRITALGIRVALSSSGMATGELYWDDGDGVDAQKKGLYWMFRFIAGQNTIHSVIEHKNSGIPIPRLGFAIIMGVEARPTKVTANGASIPFSYNHDGMCYLVSIFTKIPACTCWEKSYCQACKALHHLQSPARAQHCYRSCTLMSCACEFPRGVNTLGTICAATLYSACSKNFQVSKPVAGNLLLLAFLCLCHQRCHLSVVGLSIRP
uniref:Si:ch73-12o23.1 n=1 Tax=Eptatretus burgeri TaxID=7764 RepID=A0A8C4X285_EPTBU